MANTIKRGVGLTALTLATGTSVMLASATGANAAAIEIPDIFGGTAKAAALHVEVNIPGLPSIVQDISLTDGQALFNSVGQLVQESQGISTLGKGTLINKEVLAKLLNTAGGLVGDEKSDALLPTQQLLGLVELGLGEIKSSVTPELANSVLTSTSASQLAHLKIGLGALKDALPDLKVDLLDSVTDTVTGLAPALDGLLGAIGGLPVGQVGQVVDTVSAVVPGVGDAGLVDGLLDQLQATLGNLDVADSLLSLNLIESSNTITRKGEAVTSEAFASLGGKDTPALSVLGGLVTIDAIKTKSFATAGGKKGTAAADTTTDIINVKVGDILSLALGSNGLTGSLGGLPLPTDALNDALQQVLAAANGLLDVAGVKILAGQKTSKVDPAGQFASSSSEGLGIIVNPLKALKPLVAVQLVPAGTAVNAARVAKPAVVTPPARPLPRTGVELPLFALAGTGIAGLALVARRRRLAEI